MQIETLTLGHIRTNCYLISTDKAAIIVDPGFRSDKAEDFLIRNSDKQRMILITHSHFDHIGAASDLREKTGVKIAIGEKDNKNLSDPKGNLSDKFHAHVPAFSADVLLKDNQEITLGDLKIKVIFTPGHTVGGVSYLINDVLFSGDTLFFESIGRTDFGGGNHQDIVISINRLFELNPDTRVLSGHGVETTIGHEKQYNPYI